MRLRLLAAVAIGSAALFAVPAANAGVNCFGPSSAYVCVVTPDVVVGSRTECIYTGGTTCKNYTVPWVTTTGSVGVGCGGALYCER